MTAKDRYLASNDWRGPHVEPERPDYEWDSESAERQQEKADRDHERLLDPVRRFLGNALSGVH